MPKRRTKKAYARLYDNPESLFPGVKVTILPNGEPEIWLQSGPHSVSITAGRGPHGMGIRIRRHVLSTPLTVRHEDGDREVSVTCYDATPEAAAFARWYDHEETADDVALLGPEYRRPTPATV